MAVIFIFIDGIGIGENRSENPLASSELKSISWFTQKNGVHEACEERAEKNVLFKAIDANLDVEGLPQSGTGQTALFTGENASKLIGKHFGPWPHSKIKPLLKKKSLFHKTVAIGKKPHFLNAYPDLFFKKSKKKNRWSCTTLMVQSAGIRVNRLEDIKNESAITAEIIQSAWRNKLGLDVPDIEPEEASDRALASLQQNDLVLFEYYLTDNAGHSQDREYAGRLLDVIDRFLFRIIKNMPDNDTLVITSDHGNLEDLSTKSHTRNPVPLFVKGKTEFFKDSESILDITPAIVHLLAG